MNAVHIMELLFCVVARRCVGGDFFYLRMHVLLRIAVRDLRVFVVRYMGGCLCVRTFSFWPPSRGQVTILGITCKFCSGVSVVCGCLLACFYNNFLHIPTRVAKNGVAFW